MDTQTKNKQHFKIIEGGLKSKEDANRTFLSAFITNTRLMGVVAMGIDWQINNHPEADTLHQFFYFDVSEFGLDNYRSVWGNNEEKIAIIHQTFIGSLGGVNVSITEREALGLFTKYYRKNRERNHTLPPGKEEYDYLAKRPVELDEIESRELFEKSCADISSPPELINYFLMRYFEKDPEGMEYLSRGNFPIYKDEIKPYYSMHKNTIEEKENGYACHSLIESSGKYVLFNTFFEIDDLKVTNFMVGNPMQISLKEAAMMLTRSEYITVFDIIVTPDEFKEMKIDFEHPIMVTEHLHGRMYLAFNSNNNHVNTSNFKLNDDVFGVCYVTDYGELILGSYNKFSIEKFEMEILTSSIGHTLMPISKYEFHDPVLFDFVHSQFERFDDFVGFVQK